MNYKDLKEGQIFSFIYPHISNEHPEDMHIKIRRGFIRLPNKFTSINHEDPFPDSELDVVLLTKKQIMNNLLLVK